MKSLRKIFKINLSRFSSTQMLKELRNLSGAPLIKCKEALEKKSDLKEALQYLKEKNIIMAEKHANRSQNEGVLVYTENDSRFQVLKIKTETDFVSNNKEFLNFARLSGNYAIDQQSLKDGNNQLNDENLQQLSKEKDLLYEQKQITAKIQENIKITDLFQRTLKENEIVGSYVHDRLDQNIGTKLSYVVLQYQKNQNQQSVKRLKYHACDLAVHILCNQPQYISEKDLSEKQRNKILDNIREEIKDDKKPEKIKQKIIQGKYNKALKEDVLMNQDTYHMDERGFEQKMSVQDCIQYIQKQENIKFEIKEFDILKLKQLNLINEA